MPETYIPTVVTAAYEMRRGEKRRGERRIWKSQQSRELVGQPISATGAFLKKTSEYLKHHVGIIGITKESKWFPKEEEERKPVGSFFLFLVFHGLFGCTNGWAGQGRLFVHNRFPVPSSNQSTKLTYLYATWDIARAKEHEGYPTRSLPLPLSTSGRPPFSSTPTQPP